MSNETDLDWLALSVRVWLEGANYVCVNHTDGGHVFHEHNRNCAIWFTKDQCLARREELQNKPSWEDAPDWARWLAKDSPDKDEESAWWWYADKPVAMKNTWQVSTDGRAMMAASCHCDLGDWRDTLEKRPEEFKPFVSVEDAKITIMQSDGDVKNSGGIIGRSLPLKEDAATAKQPAPKGSGNPILGMVLADLTNRALEGKEKYGEPLLAHNGRNPLWDAYQEALDLAMYLRQAIEELG